MHLTDDHIRQLADLNRLTPKDPRRVLFIGRADGQFGGNAKYLYLHMVAQAPDLNPVYLTAVPQTHKELRSAGLPCTSYPDAGSLKAAAASATVVVDDFHYKHSPLALLTRGAKVIQLWHGVGFKKIGFVEADSGLDLTEERRQELRLLYSGYHAVVSTSPFYTEHLFATSFRAEEIWETGYPRNDVFFRKPAKHDFLGSDPVLYGELKQLAKTRAVFAYLPTFRDTGGDFVSKKALDLPSLDKALGAMNAVLVFKMHNYCGDLKGRGFANLRFMASGADIYPLLPLTSGLVTDYSSIYTDYLTMDKPVLFHPWDLEDYQALDRELQFDYDWITPGPKCRTQDELLAALKEVARGGDLGFADKRREIGQLAFARHDGDASARVLERIRDMLGVTAPAAARTTDRAERAATRD